MNFASNNTPGLFRQKYYCQTCNRQCRDKDGFKCHLNSDTHRINTEKIALNPEMYINNFSQEFEKGYIDILRRFYNNVFVSVNKVNQEYILDKDAARLNSTKWTTLTEFIKYLESKGNFDLKINEKEYLIRYRDTKPEEKFKQLQKEKDDKIKEMIRIQKSNSNVNQPPIQSQVKQTNGIVDVEKLKNIEINIKSNNNIKKSSNFCDIIKSSADFLNKKRKIEEEKNIINAIEKEECDLLNTPWLSKNLVVRIVDKSLTYYNFKGVVKNVIDNFVAEVEILKKDESAIIKIDQAYLEPVLPTAGPTSKVKIIIGQLTNKEGILDVINIKENYGIVSVKDEKFKCDLRYICKL